MVKGFYLLVNTKRVFIKSEWEDITEEVVLKILNRCQNAINDFSCINKFDIQWAKMTIQRAFYETMTNAGGHKYYKIETPSDVIYVPNDDSYTITVL